MKKSAISAIVLGATLLAGGVALAGLKLSLPVTVIRNADGSGTASGAMGAVRNSADGTEVLTCATTTVAGSVTGSCSAINAAPIPVNLTCTTTDSEMVAAIRSVTTDSFVKFLSDNTGKCISITVENASYYEPKK